MVAIIVSDKTGIPVERIDAVLGDSSLPPGPTSGGSTATATVIPAVAAASMNVIGDLLKLAATTDGSPFKGADVNAHRDDCRTGPQKGRDAGERGSI